MGVSLAMAVAVSVPGIDGVRQGEKVCAATEKSTQEIAGSLYYNFVWSGDSGSGYLGCTANTKITYEIVDGGSIADISGSKVTFKEQGEICVRATAAETSAFQSVSTLIAVSCDSRPFTNDLGNIEAIYSGKPVHYQFQGSSGISGCDYGYCNTHNANAQWTEFAPDTPGKYLVRMGLTFPDGGKSVRFSSMTIKKKGLSVKGLGVETKVFDGDAAATLTGELDGVATGDLVKLGMPQVAFVDHNAGKGKKIKVIKGKMALSGTDAGNYSLKNYDVEKLKGEIKPASVTIVADDKNSMNGDAPAKLTYSMTEKVKLDKKPTLSCKVTRKSKPGSYRIKVRGAKARNYRFSYVDGTYTVYFNMDTVYDGPDDGEDDFSTPSPKTDDFSDDDSGDGDFSGEGTGDDGIVPDWDYPDSTETTPPEGTAPPTEPASPSEAPTFRAASASGSIRFDGVTTGREVEEKGVHIEQVITNTGKVHCLKGDFEVRYRKSGWTGELDIPSLNKKDIKYVKLTEGYPGECWVFKNLKIKVRDRENPELQGDLTIDRFIVDREIPMVALGGVQTAQGIETDATLSSNKPVEVTVSALFGLTGKSVLAYRFVTVGTKVDVSDAGWKAVKDGKVTIAQDFQGQVAVKAVDCLGNYTVAYTERMNVDAAPPSVQGIEPGKEYVGEVSYEVTDISGVKSVTIDGEYVDTSGSYSKAGRHTLEAVDGGGNSVEVTFTVRLLGLPGKVQGLFQSVL